MIKQISLEKKKALKQLKALKKLTKNKQIRLAADDWNEDWQTLIATLMSARTTDKVTIPTAEQLFKKYPTLKKLAKSKKSEIAKIIKPVNFYKTKSKNIFNLSKILIKKYKGSIPHKLEELIKLPGIGRKTANVFLAEKGYSNIGVDTHVSYISNYLGWTKNTKQEKVEQDLKSLFPKNKWKEINWILVTFGQTHTNRMLKNQILNKVKEIK